MVFGSIASASSWEPFCRAIEAMSVVYYNHPDLVTTHKKYLDMINWADIDPLVELTREVACAINQGVLDDQGVAQPRPARIFVNNSLLLAISRLLMKMALAALIEAIFVVMGEPDTAILPAGSRQVGGNGCGAISDNARSKPRQKQTHSSHPEPLC